MCFRWSYLIKYFPSLQYFHQDNKTALAYAAHNGNADTVKLLLEAGASTEAKDIVSERISICTCVCVCECVVFLHHSVWEVKSVDLFYSSILFLWYVGDDDIISMNNVFVLTIIIIIIFLFVLSLAHMKINILEKSLSNFSLIFCILFFLIFCISLMHIYLW